MSNEQFVCKIVDKKFDTTMLTQNHTKLQI